jgi:glycosyltransferase involved in cell wall biosynthesis
VKIAHVLAEPTRLGGAEAHALALADAQAARGDDVTILHVRDGRDAPDGIAHRRVPDAASLRSALAALTADVVHVHGTPLAHDADAVLVDLPVVRSLHDFSFACATGEHWFRGGAACTRAHGSGCFEGMIRRGCAHRVDLRDPLRRYRDVSARLPVLRRTPSLVVYSRAVRDVALANGFGPKSVSVIPCFVERASQLPAPPEGRALAFVGRIVHAKGLDVALRALASVPSAWDELHVAGDGWARGDAERLAGSLGLGDRVTFHGWIRPEAVDALLHGARALLLPSRWPEPFGIAGLEALAHGRPVIASRVGGIPEWLDETTGILVPPGDEQALAHAVEALDGDTAAELGRAGWHHAAQFSREGHLAALDGVYRNVAASAQEAA